MECEIMLIFIIFSIVLLFIFWGVSQYNMLVTERERVSNAKAHIAAQIESRWDALTSLMSATKQYATHERETFESIAITRSSVSRNSDVDELEQEEQHYRQTLTKVLAVAEAYPDLKASTLYSDTIGSINEYEKNVRLSRMTYNDAVTRYNRNIKMFPRNIIANQAGFYEEDYFENSEEKTDMPSW